LQALSNQSFASERFEVIVVDDGSTDRTQEVLKELSSSLPITIKTILQENSGPGKARNRGANEASGEILLYIDDDIEPVPELLKVHAEHHEQHESMVVIGPMSPDPALSRTEPMWIAWEHAMLQKIYTNVKNGVWPQIGANLFYSGNASLRRDQLLAIGGFDTTFKRQEDVEMAERLHRTFHVKFIFDPAADGVHRPKRSFESWYRVPYSYGQYDVIRYRRGDMSAAHFENGFDRHVATRLLANLVMSAPFLSEPICVLMRTSAQIAWFAGGYKLALKALSALYNVRYMEGAASEIGARSEVKRLILGGSMES
jgi:glycosyltransferase involved in cell wall biosynthesis